jgi:hypothetical protein
MWTNDNRAKYDRDDCYFRAIILGVDGAPNVVLSRRFAHGLSV